MRDSAAVLTICENQTHGSSFCDVAKRSQQPICQKNPREGLALSSITHPESSLSLPNFADVLSESASCGVGKLRIRSRRNCRLQSQASYEPKHNTRNHWSKAIRTDTLSNLPESSAAMLVVRNNQNWWKSELNSKWAPQAPASQIQFNSARCGA